MDAIYPAYGRQQRIDLIVAGQGGLVNVLTGDTAAGNPGLTSMSGLVGVAIGATVAGTGIPTSPAPTVIAASDSAHTVTMSASATGTATGENITFTNPAAVGFPGLEGATIRLYKSTLSPSPATTLADLVAAECDFTGYAAKTLAVDTGYIDPTGAAIAESQLLVWVPTDAVTPNIVGGLWTDDGTGAMVIWPLAAPVSLAGPTNTLKVLALDSYPTPGSLIQVLPAA